MAPADARAWWDCIGSTCIWPAATTVLADEAYIRESILHPQAKMVAGYGAADAHYQGQVTEEDMVQLVEYIKSLGDKSEGKEPDPGRRENRYPSRR